MTTPNVSDYTNLITASHRVAPKFVATVNLSVDPFVECMRFLAGLPDDFDLDQAVGVQLDAVGRWVGRSRYITVPLETPWFSWDTAERGWDEGIWKGPLSPTTGISPLDDETYRNLLRANVLANAWDGTVGTAADILNTFYETQGVYVCVEDRQDMTMNIITSGTASVIILSIMNGQCIPVKPSGVRTQYVISSVTSSPVFGFDISNNVIGGWDAGGWGVTPAYLLGID